jgi:hypothetical protein
MDLTKVNPQHLRYMGQSEFEAVASRVLEAWENDRKENSIHHYEPVSDEARKVHLSSARTIGVGGGNRASKTTTCLAEMVMCCTGRIPVSLADPEEGVPDEERKTNRANYIDLRQKLRGPINCRIALESLTTTMHPTILPKLQWWKWIGIDSPGGKRGHWGLIPKDCLIGGDWTKSWSEKLRMLRVLYRDPYENDRVIGESTIQIMSFDQDATDFASGEFHIIMHDEPPSHAIWRENEARVMSVDGRMMLAMTWPDDPSIAVDWLFDKVYDPATRANKDPNIDWINIYSVDNPHVNQEAIAIKAENWTDEEKQVRIYGQPIRFSNRIHPVFTDQTRTWCFPCGKTTVPSDGKCSQCNSSTLTDFNHVGEFPPEPNWPTVWVLDPHPRKPHMFAWFQISPQDDIVQVAEGECEGDPTDVAVVCEQVEGNMSLHVTHRYIDPNMGRSPASARRGITWQDEFDAAGLACDLADDSDVGRARFNEYLRPDADTLEPRVHISYRCSKTIHQLKRYVWDDFRKTLEKDLKQKPKEKNDDYPTMWKYLLNLDPTFRFMQMGAPHIRRRPSPQRTKIPVGSQRYATGMR